MAPNVLTEGQHGQLGPLVRVPGGLLVRVAEGRVVRLTAARRGGVRGGERLLAVDGQEVRVLPEMQAAIRKHALGEEVRLLVQRASDPPRELVCRHVSDYPKT
jgi:S1-C subfamily serine protease